jgi:DMSO/TMAO reductase YedYZ molybdopterin-dependent catalytic subunit
MVTVAAACENLAYFESPRSHAATPLAAQHFLRNSPRFMPHESPLPPGQQLASRGKWPQVGEPTPSDLPANWTIAVEGLVEHPLQLDLAELQTLPHAERWIDIHCVTRWSKPAMRFGGVLLADLLERVAPRSEAKFISFVAHSSRRHDTSLPLADALALETLLAWNVDGEPLVPDHGGPLRVVVPGRYFYKSLKWLRTIRLLAADELGYWEREAGYHNTADPWREQRYMAPSLSRMEMRAALKSKDFSGRDLRSLDCRGHDLAGLRAVRALLRDVDFRDCPLPGACFDGANLSNGKLQGADLRGASFRDADLEGADFRGADLRDCDFRGASLFGATFAHIAGEQPTRLDATTKIDAAGLEKLMPDEEEFVRTRLNASK